ncbi:MAG: hypothetical protein U0Y82_00875 [Thermoleophilia bacterium]
MFEIAEVDWQRCCEPDCRCRRPQRFDRRGRIWTLTSIVEQAIADIGEPGPKQRMHVSPEQLRPLFLAVSSQLKRVLHDGWFIAACPWQVTLTAARVMVHGPDLGSPYLAPLA